MLKSFRLPNIIVKIYFTVTMHDMPNGILVLQVLQQIKNLKKKKKKKTKMNGSFIRVFNNFRQHSICPSGQM